MNHPAAQIRLRGRFDLDADGAYDADDLTKVVGVATALLLAASTPQATDVTRRCTTLHDVARRSA